MTILLSNDDGVTARGLALSFATMKSHGPCWVVAPDNDCSGKGHSLTLDRPLRMKEHDNGFFSVNGTPADCVNLAASGLFGRLPERVVSGINSCANLGDDVLYSGTVAAAMEGRLLAKTAIAISSCGQEDRHLEVSARVLHDLMLRLDDQVLPEGTILNVNVPACDYEKIRGMKITRLGHRHPSKPPVKITDPRGNTVWWIGGVGKPLVAEEGTDFHAVASGYVSITPLQYDKTGHATLSLMEDWLGACV
ncbi:5'/3'-nucleotidase SurE [Endozoicomonas sp. GU-1]|uniref:5'/3'-nucleotidase SurE n=1 Tax=Endozoicomonas sp. GU-1 TaxID=3009078 RepID=UPI0022B39714|nr:5'/3'-nucleotidase SurE [Endozoicomonas sp. GU-1]WBA79708.1 5'/3'-nucleotidase SurE [Endozoicomonas sp. GU-1]WBA87294.1 5'/3'-nucleotidase SurE [Endozoicomonas sp. GU-1]